VAQDFSASSRFGDRIVAQHGIDRGRRSVYDFIVALRWSGMTFSGRGAIPHRR